MMNKDFLGRGWSFPPAFDNLFVQVQMLEEEKDIHSSLEILLTTALGERIMVPQYGCNMNELVFENLNTMIKTLMKEKIQNAILYHESRIRLEKMDLYDDEQEDGKVIINIDYTIKATNSRFNFVFPFYKREGTDINLAATQNLLPDLK